MIIRTRALVLMGLIVAVSCSDSGNPIAPDERTPKLPPEGALHTLECTVAIAAQTLSCREPQPSTGAALGSGTVMLGGQNVYVRLAASTFGVASDTIGFDVTVENLIGQALGTQNGVDVAPLDSGAVRVFFYGNLQSRNGLGEDIGVSEVGNESGTATFLEPGTPYFDYHEMIAPGAVSAPRRWELTFVPGAASVTFKVFVWARIQHPLGWIDVTPENPTIAPAETVQLTGTAWDHIAQNPYAATITWSSSDGSVATVDAAGLVTGVATGSATISAEANISSPRGNVTVYGSTTVTVNSRAAFATDTLAAIGRLTVGRPAPRLLNRLADADSSASIVPGTYTTRQGGVARIYADGSYDYLSPAAFAGLDSIRFAISDGAYADSGTVVVNVAASKYWYVQAGAAGTTDGRDRFPFASVADAQAVAAAGDSVFVLSAGATALDGPAVLKDAQALIGQGIPTSITVSLNDTTVTVLAAGAAPGLSRTDAGPTVTLGLGNTIRGLGITASGGAGITGNTFGTLTTSHLGVSATGPALHLTTGTLAGDFDVLTSTNSATQGLFLSGVGGALTVTGGAISGATGTAVEIVGGDGTVTYPGNVTNSAGRSVSVTGRTGGAVTLSGDITDTGTGILATGNTAGTLAFTGTSKSLSTGANTAVTLSGNTGSTVSFENGGLKIATTTGTGFSATTGGTIAVFNGASNDDIAVSGAGAHALVLNGVTASASGIAFDTVNSSGTTTGAALHVDAVDGTGTVGITSAEVAGTAALQAGIRVADNAAPVTIASATVDGTGGAGILVSFNTGAVTVSGGTIGATTSPAGAGIQIAGGTGNVTIASSVTQNSAARVADVQDRSAGTVTLTGAMSCTSACTGILAQNNTGGVINFNATSKVLTTGANQAVTLATNSGATLGFGGGGLAVTTTTGTGFGASGGGTVTVTGANNAVSSGTGTAVSIAATEIGGTGVVFRSVSASGGANGIVLNGTGAGTFGITGDGVTAGSGGTIAPAAAGSGVSLTSVAGTTLNYLTVGGAGTGILGSGFGTLSVTGTSVGSTGAPALNLTTGTVSGTFPDVSASGSSGHGVALDGVGGTWTVASGTVTGSANGAALYVAGNQAAGTLTWQAALAQANGQPVLSVATHSNGTLNVTGTVSGTGTSTGLRFSDADATYNVTPSAATTLSGSGGAVSILALSAGTFAFSGNLNAAYGSGSVAPFAVNTSGPNVTFNGNLTTSGTASGRLVDVTSQTGGTITFQTGTLSATSGTGILLNNADGTVNFNGTTTLNGGDVGVDVENTSSGTISFASGASIANPTGIALAVSNSSPTALTFAGPITHNAGRAVSLSSVGGTVTVSGNISGSGPSASGILVQNSSGNVTFSGASKSLSTQGNAAVTLSSNTGSVLFSGGNLAITTTSGAGINASGGGGTLQVTGASNTIASGSGTPLSVQNVTIGASGLSFVSVSHSGGANGIVLVSTGTGGLQVTGSGTAGSGGSIINTTGGDGGIAGNGIYLSNARNVNLSWMGVSGTQNSGLYGTGVRGLTLNKMRFTGNNGTNVGANESPVFLEDLGGAVKLTNSIFNGGANNGIRISNTAGTAPSLDSLVIENDTVTHIQGSLTDVRGSAILVDLLDGTAEVRVRNNHLTYWWGNAIHVLIQGTASGTSRITGNTAHQTSGALAGAGGIWVAGGNHTYLISGNSVRFTDGTAISADRVSAGAHMQGTIENNTVGLSGATESGSMSGNGIFTSHHGPGTTTHRVRNNTLKQVSGDNSGFIRLVVGDASGFGGSGTVNATITGNDIQETGGAVLNAHFGINLAHGVTAGDADTGCYQVTGNTISNALAQTDRIRMNERFLGVARWPGYVGANNDNAALLAFILANNPAVAGGNVSNNVTAGGGGHTNTIPAGSACPQPAL